MCSSSNIVPFTSQRCIKTAAVCLQFLRDPCPVHTETELLTLLRWLHLSVCVSTWWGRGTCKQTEDFGVYRHTKTWRPWSLQTYKDMNILVFSNTMSLRPWYIQLPTPCKNAHILIHFTTVTQVAKTKRTCTHCHVHNRIPIYEWQALEATQTHFISWSAMLRFMYLRRAITTSPSVDTQKKWLQVTENYHGLKKKKKKNRKDKKQQT